MIARLKLLYRFFKIADKARQVELEWQKIQQDEHDFKYAFQALPSEDSQSRYLYKKGIADGIKWCLKLFS